MTDSGREEGRDSSASLRVCVSAGKHSELIDNQPPNHPSCEENVLANTQWYIAMTSEKPSEFFLWGAANWTWRGKIDTET